MMRKEGSGELMRLSNPLLNKGFRKPKRASGSDRQHAHGHVVVLPLWQGEYR